MKKILLLLVLAFSFSSCEKDDICDASTPTTPRLVIECYDNNSATPTLKNVTSLKAVATGMNNEAVAFNPSLPITDASRYLYTGSKVYLPLRTDATTTQYALTLNSGVAGSENTDIITINYAHHQVYVSRACGFKTLFDLDATIPFDVTEPATPDGAWIQSRTIVKPNLESENEVHVKIYF
jgi:hypothetical protein